MGKEVQERFERIEASLERAGQRIEQITVAHQELEAAQLNAQKAHDRLTATVEGVTEQIANLTILVNQVIERDFGRQ
jgi:archaellum component FlaC